MMRRRGEANASPNAELLVCFPKRAHLALMPPKPIGSPARPTSTRQSRIKSSPAIGIGRGGQFSPSTRFSDLQISPHTTEPTSPKVSCVGQVKASPNSAKTRSSYVGIKRDIVGFFICLRGFRRLDFRCFGAFSRREMSSDDEAEFSEAKDRFIVRTNRLCKEAPKEPEGPPRGDDKLIPPIPPCDALVLMRSMSAPGKGRCEDFKVASYRESDMKTLSELEQVMRYDAVSCDVPVPRSRSCKG